MTTTTLRSPATVAARRGGLFAGGLFAWLRGVAARHESRQALARMDDRLLADIGVSRAQALYEASKPFWRT